jgi:hypothetical protein
LAFAKKFFHFQNFSALEMAEFGSPAVDRRGDQCQCRQKFSMPVALDDLGRDCRRPQPEFLANFALNPWIQMRVRPHRAAEFSNANALTLFASSRSSARPNSSNISASFIPKVIGSA